ncbi:amino acid-binding protein [Massilia sp. H-1]|nr:amino acid-binding protein [Massilia sp. H-1]
MRIAATLCALLWSCASSLHATEVHVAFGEKIAPFCFPETDSGIELDVMREALAFRGHTMVPHYYSFARVPVAFKAGDVDASMTDLGEDMAAWGAWYGEPSVFYDNVFFTLGERKLTIRKPDDLAKPDRAVLSGRRQALPGMAGQRQTGLSHYYEQNDQALQVLTLDRGRYDVVLSDRNIFRYNTLQLKLNRSFQTEERQHPRVRQTQSPRLPARVS